MVSLNLHKKLFDFLTFTDIITIVRSKSQSELFMKVKNLLNQAPYGDLN